MANKANERDWNVVESKINLAKRKNKQLNNSRSKAFSAIAIRAILNLKIDMDEAIEAITDGSNDHGIDAIVIKGNKIHLFQMKCVDEFKNAKNKFPGLEIDKISSYLADLRGGKKQVFDKANDRIKQKTFDAMNVVSQANSKIIVHFVTNASGFSDDESKRADIKIKTHTSIKYEMHDLHWFANKFLKIRTPHLNREITVDGKNFFEQKHKNIKSLVCTVSAPTIVKMITSKSVPNNVELAMFDQNVRVYLKSGNKNNRKIIESAIAKDNHMFWYRNNGITMTCDKIIKGASDDSPKIGLKNVQIVNGGQTSISLFEAAKDNPEKIKDVLVPVRIIETGYEDIKISIAESTNSQTPIKPRDLCANDRRQRQLQDSFEDINYFYERKQNEFEDKPKDKRIDALSAGQAYLAYELERPDIAKANSGRVFGPLYETVFTKGLEVQHLLVAVQLRNLISAKKTILLKKIKNKEDLIDGERSLISGAFHILFAIRKILEREKIDIWDYDAGKDYLVEATDIVYEVYQAAKEDDLNFSPNKFFKNKQTKKLVAKKIANPNP